MTGTQQSRRHFLSKIGWLATLGSFGGLTAITGRYLFPDVLYEPPKAYKIGAPQDYLEGVNYLPDRRIFVLRHGNDIKVVSAVCTHIGCAVRWIEERGRWECPCHGTFFNAQGIVIAGPAPRPLPWYDVTIAADGRLYVNESQIVPFEKALVVKQA